MHLETPSTMNERHDGHHGDGDRPAANGTLKLVLNGVLGAALRLHHYRFVRTRMLQDALTAARARSPEDRRQR